jgi:hypothetical protein
VITTLLTADQHAAIHRLFDAKEEEQLHLALDIINSLVATEQALAAYANYLARVQSKLNKGEIEEAYDFLIRIRDSIINNRPAAGGPEMYHDTNWGQMIIRECDKLAEQISRVAAQQSTDEGSLADIMRTWTASPVEPEAAAEAAE